MRLQQMAEGRRGAAQALSLADNPGRFLSSVQVGITLIGILSGAFGGATLGARLGPVLDAWPGIAPYGGEIAVVLVVIVITALTVIIGELVPKRLRCPIPETIAVRVARPLKIVVASAPFVWLLERSTAAAPCQLGIRAARHQCHRGGGQARHRRRHRIRRHRRGRGGHDPRRAGARRPYGRRDHDAAAGRLLDRSRRRSRPSPARSPIARSRASWWRARATSAIRWAPCRRRIWSAISSPARALRSSRICSSRCTCRRPCRCCACWQIFRSVPLHIAFVIDEYGDFLGLVDADRRLEAVAGDCRRSISRRRRTSSGARTAPGVGRPRGHRRAQGDARAVDEPNGDYHTAAGLALERLARIPKVGQGMGGGRDRDRGLDRRESHRHGA